MGVPLIHRRFLCARIISYPCISCLTHVVCFLAGGKGDIKFPTAWKGLDWNESCRCLWHGAGEAMHCWVKTDGGERKKEKTQPSSQRSQCQARLVCVAALKVQSCTKPELKVTLRRQREDVLGDAVIWDYRAGESAYYIALSSAFASRFCQRERLRVDVPRLQTRIYFSSMSEKASEWNFIWKNSDSAVFSFHIISVTQTFTFKGNSKVISAWFLRF